MADVVMNKLIAAIKSIRLPCTTLLVKDLERIVEATFKWPNGESLVMKYSMDYLEYRSVEEIADILRQVTIPRLFGGVRVIRFNP